ncbi:MAG: accessory factor UbiK family protein [Gammaproteobacteria bacterium]
MSDPKRFDDFAQRLNAAVPEGLRTLQQDLDRNLRAATQAALGRLDLVTREEFEVQRKVLARTRAQVEALNARVAALEARLLGASRKPPAAADAEQDMDGG